MITNNTYFKNNIFISHAKPSISSDVVSVSAELDDFIEKYERICLIKCLGLSLFLLFEDQLDQSQENGLKDGADEKWDFLLNGRTYQNPKGETVQWRGIRFKSKKVDDKPTVSFLANFVYINYESNFDSFSSGVGQVEVAAKNAVARSASKKVTDAYREMVEMIQGRETKPMYTANHHGVGVDYFNSNEEISLYKYIEDSNQLEEDYYLGFKKGMWNDSVNSFGI